jgi:pilus assembly protein Flp/PilA
MPRVYSFLIVENLRTEPRSVVLDMEVSLGAPRREVELPSRHRFDVRQSGQGMVEYALILVLVSIVVIVVLLTMGNQIQNVFSNVVAALQA